MLNRYRARLYDAVCFKMTIDSKLLNLALKRLSPAVHDSRTQPILSYVLIKDKKITGTNTQLTYIEDLDCQADEPFLLPYFDTVSVTNNIEGEVKIVKDGSQIILTSENGDEFKLGVGEDVQLFPKIPEFEAKQKIKVDATFFNALKKAAKCVGNGVGVAEAMKNIHLIADKNKLSLQAGDMQIFYNHTITHKNVGEHKILFSPVLAVATNDFDKAEITFDDKFLSVKDKVTQVIITLSEFVFPDYSRFIAQKNAVNVEANKAIMIQALNKVMVYQSKFYETLLTFKKDSISMSHVNDSNKSADVSFVAKCTGKIDTINVLAEKLKLSMDILNSDDVQMSVATFKNPIFISNENQLILLSPYQKQENA